MSNIIYLNAGDFRSENGNLMANLGGLTLVMFHSQRCNYCINFLPVFKTLPGSIMGVNFGLFCVDNENKYIVEMSKQSSTPIVSVPKFILYTDGMPNVEYSGQRSRQGIIAFLQEIITKLNQKQSFTRPHRTRQQMPPQQMQQQMAPQMPQQQMYPAAPPAPPPQPYPQPMQAPMPPPGFAASGGPSRPPGMQATAPQGATPYKIVPTTGVKEYETSYGRPFNTTNEADFLEYENAYRASQASK